MSIILRNIFLLLICGCFAYVSCANVKNIPSGTLTRYVDPYIGTGGHGHVFLGANVPYGMVQLGPTQMGQGWDWCSGYHLSDSTILGFGHLHLSGTGIGDLGDISLMPALGNVRVSRGTLPNEETGIYSYFSHDNEIAKPGYYAVHLDRFGIDVELTATKRVGFHKYTFPGSDSPKVILDLVNAIGWDDIPLDASLKMENDTTISGYRYSTGWAKDQRIYFVAHFSKSIADFQLYDQNTFNKEFNAQVRNVYGEVRFKETTKKEIIYVKVALSPVSIENAKGNMLHELPGWNFDEICRQADKSWNDELNKIIVHSKDKSILKIFYTALYHTMIAPTVFSDVNGDYRGADKLIHRNNNFINYTTFSLWDTYRAAQPLMTIIHPEMCDDIAETFLNIFKHQGKLPIWHLMGNETNCMIGNPGVIVMADLILKGYVKDKEAAFESMKTSALLDERGLDLLKFYEYIPYDKENESVAKALEYAIADWSIAQVAKLLNKTDEYNFFLKRSRVYTRYFDKNLQFMRAIDTKGEFRQPFNPFHSNHREDDYTEGNAWQYTWLVPHDVEGLINIFGGRENFLSKLDSLFFVDGNMGDEASPDISGLIGQYAHGNELSHHIAYLYSLAGESWKTAERVREISTNLYTDKPDGLCGNEDVGQMSAWYIFSALGFYPVNPASGVYVFGSPLVKEATIQLENNNLFRVVAKSINKTGFKYVKKITLNGKPYTKPYITHHDIMRGGVLEFEMTSSPPRGF